MVTRVVLFYLVLLSFFGYQNLRAQEDFNIPPSIKKMNYADREITFSNVTMNGKKITFLEVEKGDVVTITTRIESKRKGDYCPGCIVQVYWGLRGYISLCAKSFYGYQFLKKKSKLIFNAPLQDGIYYITTGGSLEYSCKNNLQRPRCSADNAFAVLKVGNPDLEKKITLEKIIKDNGTFLKTTLIKPGGFGDLNEITWFFNGEKLDFDNRNEIPVTDFGKYKVVWSNCFTSISDSLDYSSNDEKIVNTTIEEGIAPVGDGDMAVMVENRDGFVLKNLIFDLNEAIIKPEAKKELSQLAQIMKAKPSVKILLEGHTAIGNAKKNQILSEERVKSTKAYLVKHGVARENIQIKGWGQTKPLIITRDIEKGKINRRVEIRILSR
ncbi:OmpA family protein [Flagellimonas sp. 389]|uniref:OmpA family protein n=1 Tax=Flagellimonas sp. 389 TaxID=2835862 RepID=UPI001BD5F9D3|nr:OmpA family protein [Flagellimonas sp. 389]MBS9463476.1 OmpA family protein [Flagellimonas sp. 389]